MSAAIGVNMRLMSIAMVHLWITQRWLDVKELPIDYVAWIYSRDIGWGEELLQGKRVRVSIEIEDDPHRVQQRR